MIIRMLLLGAIVSIGYYVFLRRGKLPVHILVLIAMLGVAAVFVVDPQLSDPIARFVGVGRGADLIIYLVLVGLLFIALHYYTKFVELQTRLAILVRELAHTNSRVDELSRLSPLRRPRPGVARRAELSPRARPCHRGGVCCRRGDAARRRARVDARD